MVGLRSKLPNVGTTIFTVMSQLAAEHSAINLSQGYPDFDPPVRLVDSVVEQLRHGSNQYAPMTGLPALREAIAAKLSRSSRRPVLADQEVTITSGATEALFCVIQALVGPGDEVVLLEPAYDAYEPAVNLAGARTIRVPLSRPGFRVDWDRVGDAISARTRLVVVNSPHNPSGATFDSSDLDALAELMRGSGACVLSDEVYEHMVFDGRVHHSVLGRPELAERGIVVSSFGKTYHATGWKVGYCVAPPDLSAEIRKVHQFVQFAVATPLQAGIADFLREYPHHDSELADFYQRKRDLFCNLLGETRFTFTPSQGTYFQLVDYSSISDRSDTDFARWLTIEAGVAAIPISVFSAKPQRERVVRLCFAKHDATLKAAAQRLARI
jgi:methionine aminotransferase